MKPTFEFLCVVEKKPAEYGDEYCKGIHDSARIKKTKESPIIVMKGNYLPESLVGNEPLSRENIYVFINTSRIDHV